MPRIFIGIPTFNRPALVREAIASVQAQSFTDFHVLVSDNCSPPDAAEAVRMFVAGLGDTRFSFHQQAVNQGEYGQARRFRTASAEYEFFVMLHDDDILEPGYLAAAITRLDAAPEAGLFVANFYMMDEAASRLERDTVARRRLLRRDGAQDGRR